MLRRHKCASDWRNLISFIDTPGKQSANRLATSPVTKDDSHLYLGTPNQFMPFLSSLLRTCHPKLPSAAVAILPEINCILLSATATLPLLPDSQTGHGLAVAAYKVCLRPFHNLLFPSLHLNTRKDRESTPCQRRRSGNLSHRRFMS